MKFSIFRKCTPFTISDNYYTLSFVPEAKRWKFNSIMSICSSYIKQYARNDGDHLYRVPNCFNGITNWKKFYHTKIENKCVSRLNSILSYFRIHSCSIICFGQLLGSILVCDFGYTMVTYKYILEHHRPWLPSALEQQQQQQQRYKPLCH